LALVLPLLLFICGIVADYSRVYHYSQTITDCARNGALYACNPDLANRSPYFSLEEAALANAPLLKPAPEVTSVTGTDDQGHEYVEVTVSWIFRTVTKFPGIPRNVDLSRTVRMRLFPGAVSGGSP
jgi:Flp pilus assembly protein TadG